MRVTLVDVQEGGVLLNKDLAGGFGTSSSFGRSPFLRLISRLKRGSVRIPVMALGYLSSVLGGRGFDVRLSQGEPVEGTDLYIVYTSLVAHGAELRFARSVKGQGARVGFVGPMAHTLPELFTQHADFVVRGEPEAVMRTLEPGAISGIVGPAIAENLDDLPFPGWGIFDWRDFSYSIYLKRRPVFPVLSSRGCSYPCAYFCPYPMMQGRCFRARSPENVVGELEYLVREFGAKGIIFRDPNFAFDRERAEAIAEGIIRANLDMEWACETRAEHLSGDILKVMHRAGLRGINVGVAFSGSEMLKACEGESSLEGDLFEFVSRCKKMGIKVGAFYTLGTMEDTRASIECTMGFAKKLNTDYAQFTLATPYPGTALYESVRERITAGSWEDYDGYTPVFRHPAISADDLVTFKEKAMRSYYLRAGWLLRYLGVR